MVSRGIFFHSFFQAIINQLKLFIYAFHNEREESKNAAMILSRMGCRGEG